jgi:alkylated DNA repair protein alkB family protein 8
MNIQPILYIPGLHIVYNAISEQDEAEYLRFFTEKPLIWDTTFQRRRIQYGYEYNYLTGKIRPTYPIDFYLVPAIIYSYIYPEQIIVNEYLPGQGIGPHIDSFVFGDTICSLSLGSDTIYRMIAPNGVVNTEVSIPRRSLVIMTGASRTHWRHCIPNRTYDYERPRGLRYSITYRTLATV